MIKANFKIKDYDENSPKKSINPNEEKKELSQEEFEEFIVRSGASGSFMVFRSNKKEDELGLDEL